MGAIKSKQRKKTASSVDSSNTTAATPTLPASHYIKLPARSTTPMTEIVVALYPLKGRDKDELSFEKGDRFEVFYKTDQDWWYCENLATRVKGIIPCIFVVSATSLQAQDWYFGETTRKEAEKILGDHNLQEGTYLVRDSESSQTGYSLSVKGTNVKIIIHHRIETDAHRGFYLNESVSFTTLQDLLSYYSEVNPQSNKGLLLVSVCPKFAPELWDLSAETKDKYEIDRNTLSCNELVGSGNFGEVHHGYWNGTRDVAIKTMKAGTMTVKAFLDEASVMKKLRHVNILILYAVCTREQPILIVTEYMNKGSLLSVLLAEGKRMSAAELLEICTQVATGMAYIEKKGLIHRDLAARNVLMDNRKQCKIADFGLARIIGDGVYNSTSNNEIPVRWTAPEALSHNSYTIKSDVWSFGILMMEVVTLGGVPYPDKTNKNVRDEVPFGYRMPKPMRCHEHLYNIMLQCWAEVPEERVSFDHLEYCLGNYVLTSQDVGYVECFLF